MFANLYSVPRMGQRWGFDQDSHDGALIRIHIGVGTEAPSLRPTMLEVGSPTVRYRNNQGGEIKQLT